MTVEWTLVSSREAVELNGRTVSRVRLPEVSGTGDVRPIWAPIQGWVEVQLLVIRRPN